MARQYHPDITQSQESSKQFAMISKAYQVLSDPKERASYDAQMQRVRSGSTSHNSILDSANPHAARLRRIQIQRRMDATVDKLIADERRETMELQMAVYPCVALFLSTFFVGMLRPQFLPQFHLLGKIIILALFTLSIYHLFGRLKFAFGRYTQAAPRLHDTIFEKDDEVESKFSRRSAVIFLLVGLAVSLTIGWFVGKYIESLLTYMLPSFIAPRLHPEMIVYPPIAVLIIDTMHNIAVKAEGG